MNSQTLEFIGHQVFELNSLEMMKYLGEWTVNSRYCWKRQAYLCLQYEICFETWFVDDWSLLLWCPAIESNDIWGAIMPAYIIIAIICEVLIE